MASLDLATGKRTPFYRFLEIMPAVLSYGAIIVLVVLSIVNPNAAAIYLMIVIITLLVKSVGIAYRTILGHRQLTVAQKIDWHGRLNDLEDPVAALDLLDKNDSSLQAQAANLRAVIASPSQYPKPSQLYQGVIVAAYNEAYDVIQPTIESIKNTNYNNKQIILFFAYEERGGAEIEKTAKRLQREYKDVFYDFQIVKHPADMPGEVKGKGPNIT